VARDRTGLLRFRFRGTLSRKRYRTHAVGDDNGNDTDDSSRTSNNIESIHPYHRTKNVRHRGTGGDDFLCGHCGTVMLEDFDPSTIRGNPVYQCAYCENNTYHSQQVTVATGRRGDPGRRCREARAKSQSRQLHHRDDSRTAAASWYSGHH
jgi:hypothetical protein